MQVYSVIEPQRVRDALQQIERLDGALKRQQSAEALAAISTLSAELGDFGQLLDSLQEEAT